MLIKVNNNLFITYPPILVHREQFCIVKSKEYCTENRSALLRMKRQLVKNYCTDNRFASLTAKK